MPAWALCDFVVAYSPTVNGKVISQHSSYAKDCKIVERASTLVPRRGRRILCLHDLIYTRDLGTMKAWQITAIRMIRGYARFLARHFPFVELLPKQRPIPKFFGFFSEVLLEAGET